LFVSRLGRRLEVSAARWDVYAAARRAGLPAGPGGVSPHWLRHAHATHATEQGGAGAHPVKATLGHASVATTSTYRAVMGTDVLPRELRVPLSLAALLPHPV
jgi:site-specific recombinase XerD